MDERVGGVYLEVSAELDKSEPKKTISKLRAEAAKEPPVEVEIRLDKNGRARDQFGRFLKSTEGKSIDLPIQTRGESNALARLAHIASDRVARILVAVDRSSGARARSYLASLTGGNVFAHTSGQLSNLMRNLDTATLSVAKLGLQFGSLAMAGTAAVGSLAVAVTQIASIAKMGLALPGVMTGFAVGIAGSLDGLQNIAMHLQNIAGYDLLGDFVTARLQGGQNFWATASSQLEALRDNLFRPFFAEYVGMMGHLGAWWERFFAGISSGLGAVGGMAVLFEPLNRAIQIATEGAQPLAEAIIKLGAAGGQYLPSMAGHFVTLSNRFNEWITEATASGKIFEMIDSGVENFKLLVGVVVQTATAFAHLGSIAEAAGSTGLAGFLRGLEAINGLLAGGAFRDALVTVFSGANEGLARIAPGLSDLKNAFISLAPTISSVFQSAGTALSWFISGLSKALSNPIFQQGLAQFFESLARAMETLQPTFEVMGTKFGEIASVMAVVMDTAAPLINQITTGLAPAFSQLMQGVQVLVPVLGDMLGSALDFLIPIISQVVTWVGSFIEKFPGLSAGVLIGVSALTGLGLAVAKVVSFFGPLFTLLGSVVTKLGGFGAIMGTVGGWFSTLGGFIVRLLPYILRLGALFTGLPGLIIGALSILVPLIISNWDTIVAWTTQAWNTVLEWTRTAWQGIKDFIAGIVDGVVQWVATAWGTLTSTVSEIWAGIVAAVMGVLTGLYESIMGWAAGILAFWLGVWTGLRDTVTNAFNSLVAFLSPILEGIVTLFTAFTGFLGGLWSLFWEGLTTVVSGVWALLSTIVMGGLQIIVTLFQEITAMVVGIWNTFWTTLVTFLSPIITSIVTTVSTGFTMVQSFISSILSAIWSVVSSVWNSIVSAVTTAVTAVWSVVSSIFNQVSSFISSVLSTIFSVVSSIWNSILSTVISVVTSIWSSISSAFNNILSTISSVASAIWNVISTAFNNMLSTVTSVVSSIWSAISSAFSNIVSTITSAGSNALNAIRSAFNAMLSAVASAIAGILGKVRSIPGSISAALGNLGSLLTGSGRALMQGFLNGITSMIGVIQNKVSSAVQSIRDFFPFSPAKVGPFSGRGYTTYSGKALMGDFGDSLAQAATAQRPKVATALATLRPEFSGVLGDLSPAPAPVSAYQPAQAPLVSVSRETSLSWRDFPLEELARLIESRPTLVSLQIDSREIARANVIGSNLNNRR